MTGKKNPGAGQRPPPKTTPKTAPRTVAGKASRAKAARKQADAGPAPAGKETIEAATRRQVTQFLPDAIAQALRSYYRFSLQDPPAEPKEFSAHHSACKVAVAHIELLIKLAGWAELPEADGPDPNAPDENSRDQNTHALLIAMMQEAQDELNKYNDMQLTPP